MLVLTNKLTKISKSARVLKPVIRMATAATTAAVFLLAVMPAGDALAATNKKAKPTTDWSLHGRLQVDAAQFDSDNPLYSNDIDLRRARLALNGRFSDGWRVKIEYEFSGSTPGPKSLWVRKSVGENGTLTAGHFKEPFSLQNATSSRYNTFMERALPNAGAAGYQLGAMASTYGDAWSVAAGIATGGLTDQFNLTDEGTGYFGRVVLNPATSKHQLWHFGLSSELRTFGGSDSLRLRERPEADLSTVRMVDTSALSDLDSSFRYMAEFAWQKDALNFQAEYLDLNVSRNAGEDLGFSGWYAQAGWFITGETRRYNRHNGSFKKVKPNRSSGAWEVAVRVSELDLNSAEVAGGKESNTGLALNWYANDDVRVSLNYIDASGRPNSLGEPEDVSIIEARFQFLF